jgi:hypothetical protein
MVLIGGAEEAQNLLRLTPQKVIALLYINDPNKLLVLQVVRLKLVFFLQTLVIIVVLVQVSEFIIAG